MWARSIAVITAGKPALIKNPADISLLGSKWLFWPFKQSLGFNMTDGWTSKRSHATILKCHEPASWRSSSHFMLACFLLRYTTWKKYCYIIQLVQPVHVRNLFLKSHPARNYMTWHDITRNAALLSIDSIQTWHKPPTVVQIKLLIQLCTRFTIIGVTDFIFYQGLRGN